jgi:glycosyltransferase involved in cell wall biosynthesis
MATWWQRTRLGGAARRAEPADAADTLPPRLSARGGATRAQRRAGLLALALLAGCWWLAADPLLVLALALSPVCLLACVVHLGASLERPPAGPVNRQVPAILPRYTILVPLYREARVLPQLLAALRRLAYPRDRLEVILLLETDDTETLAALMRSRLEPWERPLVVPAGVPRTKPRALNHGLAEAVGDLLVVYDAEDIPDPDQLLLAAALFGSAGPEVACLQARLVIDNDRATALSSLFALEYLALFQAVKPGLAADDLAVPLGGTSNHFRTALLRGLGGWDAWNVTEDADLGIRLARAGYRVADLPSTTAEEAPERLGLWLRQRRRWLKGWIQTALVHGRAPAQLYRELGLVRTLCAIGAVPAPYLSALVYPLFSALFLYRLLQGELTAADSLPDAIVKALMWVVFASGLAASAIPALIGARRAGRSPPWPLYLLQPFYACLVSLAAWLALYDYLRRPFHWWKTEHGLARRPARAAARPVSEAGDDGVQQRAGEDALALPQPEEPGREHGQRGEPGQQAA